MFFKFQALWSSPSSKEGGDHHVWPEFIYKMAWVSCRGWLFQQRKKIYLTSGDPSTQKASSRGSWRCCFPMRFSDVFHFLGVCHDPSSYDTGKLSCHGKAKFVFRTVVMWFELCELFLPWKRYQDHFWTQNFRGSRGIFTVCKTSRLSLESKRCAWMPRLSGRSLGWTSYLTLCDIYLKDQFLLARPHPPLVCGHGDAVFQCVFHFFFIFLGSAMTHLHMIPENFPAMERPNLSFEPLWCDLSYVNFSCHGKDIRIIFERRISEEAVAFSQFAKPPAFRWSQKGAHGCLDFLVEV